MVENVIQMKSEIKICVDVIVKIQRNIISVNKIVWIPSTCACEIDEYIKNIIGDSVFTCDEIIFTVAKSYNDTSETESINLSDKKTTCNMVYYILDTIIFSNQLGIIS